jgi:DnaJ-domain-containing protein 1
MMARHKEGPKRPSIFQKGYCPYGEYEGPRWTADQWRAAFRHALSDEQVTEILGEDSPWGILGIQRGASMDEIKRAYRRAAQKWHPDKHQGAEAKAKATKMFIRAKAAYIKLGGKQ